MYIYLYKHEACYKSAGISCYIPNTRPAHTLRYSRALRSSAGNHTIVSIASSHHLLIEPRCPSTRWPLHKRLPPTPTSTTKTLRRTTRTRPTQLRRLDSLLQRRNSSLVEIPSTKSTHPQRAPTAREMILIIIDMAHRALHRR